MNSTALSTKGGKLAVSALLAAVAFMALAFSASSAKAANAGDPITPDFNYVGINIGTTIAGDINDIVYDPSDGPAMAINGEYTDSNGNFKVPKVGGLTFPPIAVDLDLLVIDGEIGLTEDGTGTYDENTGKMTMDLDLSLTLGVNDLAALSEEVGIPLGTGELRCQFAPLEVESSTEAGWPAPGKNFVDKANLEDGALAGAWRAKPSVVAIVGDQSVCNIISGFLKPVGGIWLANDPGAALTDMPTATADAPAAKTCATDGPDGKTEGTWPNCKVPECPEGQVGTPPDCNEPVPPVCKVASVKVGKAKVKAGKKAKVKVTVRNNGTAACKGKVTLKSNKKFAKVAKSVAVNVAAGKSQTKTVVVKTTKKAKGKVKITATFQKKKGNGVVTVQKAKKAKKKRK